MPFAVIFMSSYIKDYRCDYMSLCIEDYRCSVETRTDAQLHTVFSWHRCMSSHTTSASAHTQNMQLVC